MGIAQRGWSLLLATMCTVAFACNDGGGGGSTSAPSGTEAVITGVTTAAGVTASYHTGPLPAPHGSLTITVPTAGTSINGGTTMVNVTASATIVTIYVGVANASGTIDGYWAIDITGDASIEQILFTLAQSLASPEFPIVFEAADAAGDVSEPATMVTTVHQVGTGDVQVSISWDVNNDIDLHVTDPNGFEIFYGDRTSPQGGTLDLDSNAACSIDGVNNENITWPTGDAPHGTYIVRVDNFENCQSAAANFVVTVHKAGQAAATYMGSFPASDPGDEGSIGAGVTVTQFTYP